MDPASAALGQRIFDVAWKVVGAGVALLAGAMVLNAVRSMLDLRRPASDLTR
jgi:hypothetical protein